MIEIILTIIIGTIIGLITGILPGMHINFLAVIIASLVTITTDNLLPATLIISIGVTHNIIEAIPTIFLNTPTPETALLPAQKFLKEGKGQAAAQLFFTGAMLGTITTVIVSPLLFLIIPLFYQHVKNYTATLLIAIVVILILKEQTVKEKIWAVIIVVLSGILGLITLTSTIDQPLFLLFSGLFGTSTLVFNLMNQTKIPEQDLTTIISVRTKHSIQAVTGGISALMLTTLLPGIGAAQASWLPTTMLKITGKKYLVLLGSIGTADIIISMITFVTINKARNGAIEVISNIATLQENIPIFFATAMITAGIATLLAGIMIKRFVELYNKINYQKLCIALLILLFSTAYFFAGFNGILVMTTGLSVGIIPLVTGTARSHAMSCLILPILLRTF
ncbi:tripartite tricarboxylate transporter permease [Candidatus Woesearchaeota archaeon]|nr:tripartite tricarboxylate transporter permease [Candidatus Woesearchaeota archaeon]